MSIGRLVEVPLREIWKHEEHNFSVWLAENIDALSEAIGVPLTVLERETFVGPFQADIVAQDGLGNRVIIENQLEQTDHDHLGKLLTYLTNLDGKKAIWIVREHREEHARAIQWLNEFSPEDIAFYLVQVKVYRIGDSAPAPSFSIIVRPSAESRALGQEKKELAKRELDERKQMYMHFWEGLLNRAKARSVTTHAGRTPGQDNWLTAGAGISGLEYVYTVAMRDGWVGVELAMNTSDKTRNKAMFDRLFQLKDQIEQGFGGLLEWQRMDETRVSRIRYSEERLLLRDETTWAAAQDAMVDAMARLARASKPYIERLRRGE